MRIRLPLVAVLVCLGVACGGGTESGGGNSVTGPSTTIPNVAGSYSGTTTVAFPELRISCPTTTVVTQGDGGRISIAPLQLGGACGGMSLAFGDATITSAGSLHDESGSLSESCGVYTYVASGGFFGREMRISATYTSNTCDNMNLTINLVRP
jgi:hypothetical protein